MAHHKHQKYKESHLGICKKAKQEWVITPNETTNKGGPLKGRKPIKKKHKMHLRGGQGNEKLKKPNHHTPIKAKTCGKKLETTFCWFCCWFVLVGCGLGFVVFCFFCSCVVLGLLGVGVFGGFGGVFVWRVFWGWGLGFFFGGFGFQIWGGLWLFF